MVQGMGGFSRALGPMWHGTHRARLISLKQTNLEIIMQKLLLTATLAAIALSAVAPAQALSFSTGLFDASMMDEFDRRRPRVPGGSGCDSPRDIIEHPECTPA